MTRRKGELSKSTIDRDWPHQVAMPAEECTGHNYRSHHYFIAYEKLSLCPRGHTFYRGARDFHVFCFAEREHAETFQRQFGGEFIDPEDRPRWPGRR
jgi:hypothetical protein